MLEIVLQFSLDELEFISNCAVFIHSVESQAILCHSFAGDVLASNTKTNSLFSLLYISIHHFHRLFLSFMLWKCSYKLHGTHILCIHTSRPFFSFDFGHSIYKIEKTVSFAVISSKIICHDDTFKMQHKKDVKQIRAWNMIWTRVLEEIYVFIKRRNFKQKKK